MNKLGDMSKHYNEAEAFLIKLKPFDELIPNYDIGQFEKQSSVFRELVAGVIYQQISIKAAASIYAKFCRFFEDVDYQAIQIVNSTHESLRACGLSNQKANYVRNIAHFFIDNKLEAYDWDTSTDAEIIKMLTSIKGVGEWTVQMLLMFYLERPDVFPVKDLGVQMAMKSLYNLKLEKRALEKELTRIASDWQPYRTVASKYMWAWKREN